MIPRVIHQVWLGADPVPAIFDYYLESWKKHHPAWQIRRWHDDTLPALACQDLLDAEKGFKKRYDSVRLEILRQFGGVIVDMDVEAIRPLDPLLTGVTAFVGRIGTRHVGNQVLGAVPHHPFFERAVEQLRVTADSAGTSESAGKQFLRRLLDDDPAGVTVFPADTFYYQPASAPAARPDEFPQVYAVHHELKSYTVPVSRETLEHRFARFSQEAAALRAVDQRDSAALALARGRLEKAEQRLRRAVVEQDEGYQAIIRRAEIEREQLQAQLREARRRIDELERRS